jgi:hypothetical protein
MTFVLLKIDALVSTSTVRKTAISILLNVCYNHVSHVEMTLLVVSQIALSLVGKACPGFEQHSDSVISPLRCQSLLMMKLCSLAHVVRIRLDMAREVSSGSGIIHLPSKCLHNAHPQLTEETIVATVLRIISLPTRTWI